MMIKNRIKKTTNNVKSMKNKRGFSLVELVVVIAILAVIAAVLVPALLQYTESSRAQKDASAMDEVVNAVQLAMSDSNCFDEMEKYACDNNFITYTDSSGKYGQQVVDAEYWAPDGYGRATTITFNPETDPASGDTIYRLENAIINDITYGNGSVGDSLVIEGAKVDNIQCFLKNAKLSENTPSGYLYNRVRQTIGDNVIKASQTYRNSSFTIFIRFSSKDGAKTADVNGSFNGTNLEPGSSASVGSGTNSEVVNPETGNKEQGPATKPSGGTTSANFSGSALSGGGSSFGGINNEYKQDHVYSDSTSYYATIFDAITAINNNTLNQSTLTEQDGVVCVYQSGSAYEIVLMKDSFDNKTSDFSKDIILNLNGHTAKFDVGTCFIVRSGNFQINGSKKNSKVVIDRDADVTFINTDTKRSNISIIKGEYDINVTEVNTNSTLTHFADVKSASSLSMDGVKLSINNMYTTALAITSAGTLTITNSTIEVTGEHNYSTGTDISSYAIVLDGGKTTLNNCKIYTKGYNYSYSQCLRIKSGKCDVSITNCVMDASSNIRYVSGVGCVATSIAISVANTTAGTKINVKNSYLYGGYATLFDSVESKNPDITFDNCELEGTWDVIDMNGATVNLINGTSIELIDFKEDFSCEGFAGGKHMIITNSHSENNIIMRDLTIKGDCSWILLASKNSTNIYPTNLTFGKVTIEPITKKFYSTVGSSTVVIEKGSNITSDNLSGYFASITTQ